jgi:integrase
MGKGKPMSMQVPSDVVVAFARQAATDAAPHVAYSERDLEKAVALLAMWAWQSAGLPLEREVILARATIGRFTSVGLKQYTEAGRGNIRSQLLRTGEALLSARQTPKRLPPLGPSTPTSPYSSSEVAALRSWAARQSTAARRANADVLLSLGLGAGLSASEIGFLRVSDIQADETGVIITVGGSRPRSVPVTKSWEKALIERTLNIDPERWAFRERHTINYPNLISNFVARSGESAVLPQSQRMRATWLVGHLAGGTPVVPLMQASGVESLEALTRYLQFVPTHDPGCARRALSEISGCVCAVSLGARRTPLSTC